MAKCAAGVLLVAAALASPGGPAASEIGTAAPASSHPGLLLEAGFDTGQVYLNAQAVYTVRFYQAIDVRELHLQTPEIQFAELRRIGEDRIDQETLDGRRHRVTERRYAVFPFASGTISATGAHAAGLVAVPGAAPGTRAPVRLEAPAATLDVLPMPAQAGSGPWLPARDLTLTESWSPDPRDARVGQALIRTIRIEATGLEAALLPELVPVGDGITAHPGPPRLANRFDELWNVGSREQDWRIVPTRTGTVAIPEFHLDWWDARSGERRTARLPGRTLEVAPAPALSLSRLLAAAPAAGENVDVREADAGATAGDVSPQASDPVEERSAGQYLSGTEAPPDDSRLLIFSALFAVAMALAAYVAWRCTRRPDRAALRALRTACRRNDPHAARDALLAWAEASRPDSRAQTLNNVIPLVPGPLSRRAIAELDRHLYGPEPESWQGTRLMRFPRS